MGQRPAFFAPRMEKTAAAGVLVVKSQQGGNSMGAIGPEQLTQVLDEHGPALVLYARQWCHAPEDVVQDAFVKLMHARPVPTNLAGWLYRVVRNGAISTARSQARRTRHEAAAGSATWFTADPDEALDAAEATRALANLPLEEREVIVLRLWGGRSFEQIAELTETSISTAHRRYTAGLSALRERERTCTSRTNRDG